MKGGLIACPFFYKLTPDIMAEFINVIDEQPLKSIIEKGKRICEFIDKIVEIENQMKAEGINLNITIQ